MPSSEQVPLAYPIVTADTLATKLGLAVVDRVLFVANGRSDAVTT
ncbi:MAG: hypothetical protein AAGG56_01070 [Pseudomonadota bacterium]